MPPSQTNAIRQDLAVFRATYETSMVTLVQHLEEIKKGLKELNGTVRDHELWIAGQEPVCKATIENLSALTLLVTSLTNRIAEERGARKARTRMAIVGNALLIIVLSAVSAWSGAHAAILRLMK